MASSVQENYQCSVCRNEGETTPATHWCSECEACFCDECIKMHMKMPSSQKHDVSILHADGSLQKMNNRFFCREHDEKMKLFCEDCNEPLCTVCCSISHRKCKDVVTLQTMLPELKEELQNRQRNLTKKIDAASTDINIVRCQVDMVLANTSVVKSKQQEIIQNALDYLKQKETELLEKVEAQKDEKIIHFRSKVETREMEIQTYQQQSALIQQALKLEDEAQLYEMFLSSGSGSGADVTETQREDETEVADIRFTHDLEGLKEEIDKMEVKTVESFINLSATPVLSEVIDKISGLLYVLVVKVKDTNVRVIADQSGKKVSTYYTSTAGSCKKEFAVDSGPFCLTDLSDGKVAVSVPHSKSILILNVHPDIVVISTMKTNQEYFGLAVVDQSTLAASSLSPPSVDVLDMKGRVMRSIQTLPAPQNTFKRPRYIHVTNGGHILVSDCGLKSVICLTQTGDVVFTYTPTGDRALRYPRDITSTSTGDILVADCDTDKVSHLSQSGQFIRDILTSEDGLVYPYSLCVDEEKLYVSDQFIGVLVYQFTN